MTCWCGSHHIEGAAAWETDARWPALAIRWHGDDVRHQPFVDEIELGMRVAVALHPDDKTLAKMQPNALWLVGAA